MSNPNLIPLQVDRTTGSLVAAAVSGTGTVTSVTVNGTAGNITSSGSPITVSGTITLNLATTAVTPGSYTSANITVDAFGRVTAAANGSGGGGVTSFNTRTGAVTLTSADVTTAVPNVGSFTNNVGYLTIAVTSLTAGTGINVSASTGAVTISNTGVTSFNTRTGAVTLTSGDVTTAVPNVSSFTNDAGYLTANQAITLSGDVTGSGTTAITTTLATVTTAGTFGNSTTIPVVTVNAKGLITNVTTAALVPYLPLAGGTMTGTITMTGGSTVTGLPSPINASDAAPKSYVDNAIEGLSWKTSVQAATLVNLAGTYVGSPTFTLTASPPATLPTIDGYAPNVGDRLLVKSQTTLSQNGIYVVTQTTSPWILTRSSDFNETTPIDEVNGAAVYVNSQAGATTQQNTAWTQIDKVVTFDTDPIAFAQFSGGGGSGTVTNVIVTTQNGVSATVSNPTTTPTLAFTLGAITPSSVVASGTVTGSNLTGTNTGDQTITLTGDVTGSGTGSFATTLATVNGNVGTFESVTVNGKGLVTAATTLSGDVTSSSGVVTLATVNGAPGTFSYATLTVNAKGLVTSASNGTAPVTSVSGTAAQISSSGGTTPTLALVTTAVTPGSYTSTNLTVDAYGRITAAANGSGGGSGTVTSVSVTTANGVSGTVATATTTPAITLTLGAITPSSVAASGTLSGSNFSGSSSGTNTGDQTITLTGDVTGSGTGSFATTLATVNTDVGSFTNVSLTVNAKGLITAASSGTAPVISVSGTAGDISSTGGANPVLDLVATAVTPGSYTSTNLTVDAFGRITAAANGSGGGASRTETVVWQYSTTAATGFSGSPVSMTSGVASATGNSSGLTTYTFTGYTNPPTAVASYGQVITNPTFQWSIVDGFLGLASGTLSDTGTITAPGLITSFSSSDVLSLQLDGTVTNASTNNADKPYLVVVFKF